MPKTLETDLPHSSFKSSNLKGISEAKVLGAGLEPAHLTAPEPKSGVSANSTTRARGEEVFSENWHVNSNCAPDLHLNRRPDNFLDHQLALATMVVGLHDEPNPAFAIFQVGR
jgi:hypothetical protein